MVPCGVEQRDYPAVLLKEMTDSGKFWHAALFVVSARSQAPTWITFYEVVYALRALVRIRGGDPKSAFQSRVLLQMSGCRL